MRSLSVLLTMPLLAACTTSQTDVLAPYTLANGQYMQDVVTVATDKSGGAPIVTVVNTYDVSARKAALISHDAASSPGLATVIAGGLAGSIPNALATVGAAALQENDEIKITGDCTTNQNQSQQGTSVGGKGGRGGRGGDGGNSIGFGRGGDADADGGNGGDAVGGSGGGGGDGGDSEIEQNGLLAVQVAGTTGSGGAGGAGAAGGTATSTGGLANAVGGSGTGIGGPANGGVGGIGGSANALTDLLADNSNGACDTD